MSDCTPQNRTIINILGSNYRTKRFEFFYYLWKTINSNANQTLIDDIYWQAILNGEF